MGMELGRMESRYIEWGVKNLELQEVGSKVRWG